MVVTYSVCVMLCWVSIRSACIDSCMLDWTWFSRVSSSRLCSATSSLSALWKSSSIKISFGLVLHGRRNCVAVNVDAQTQCCFARLCSFNCVTVRVKVYHASEKFDMLCMWLGGCTVLNMYEYTWVHRRDINLNTGVLCIHTINTFRTENIHVYLHWTYI